MIRVFGLQIVLIVAWITSMSIVIFVHGASMGKRIFLGILATLTIIGFSRLAQNTNSLVKEVYNDPYDPKHYEPFLRTLDKSAIQPPKKRYRVLRDNRAIWRQQWQRPTIPRYANYEYTRPHK